ncbi:MULTISPECIES: RraA family protein [Nocardiopsidaceae]|uniref:Putative 4-hydroxy-4-methyl-2-oxoglutarate aldolase n=1 Tax=Streptomonospora nanhaiensis TaxID=1323731 RepID=A0ABY6YHN9_9ACTN|nr:RraA family protein [Streptomonospora nanhaiensis]WAE71797.1 RraA family protein [Streptomonospora nanhaiensis]
MPDTGPDTAALLRALAGVELPTLGHVLEEGFCDPAVRTVTPGAPRMGGEALTVHLAEPDALAVNRALVRLPRGGVLVVGVDGGAHAPIGAVTAAAVAARGGAGIVVDGPVTDLAALRDSGLPVYARGSTCRTTKRLGTATGAVGAPVTVGGVRVRTGDLVLGDENGLLVVDPRTFDRSLVEGALRSDRDEPGLVARIRAGEPLTGLLAL